MQLKLLTSANSPQTKTGRRRNDKLIIEYSKTQKADKRSHRLIRDLRGLRSKSKKKNGRQCS